jgi:endogenous inhibitor of DNA gyrase (YacG/DUF329 family)
MKCVTCKKAIQPRPENKYAPFCSERCRLADLNHWINGSYAIPGQPVDVSTEQSEPSQELPD